MRNKQHIAKEIVELCAIKASYNHYLASHRSIFEVENTTQVMQNRSVISGSLRELYKELEEDAERGKIIDDRRKTIDERQNAANHKSQTINSKPETSAIMHFNADRRFTITE